MRQEEIQRRYLYIRLEMMKNLYNFNSILRQENLMSVINVDDINIAYDNAL